MSKRYNEQFINEVVAFTFSTDQSYLQISRDFGVDYKTLCAWVRTPMNQSKSPKT